MYSSAHVLVALTHTHTDMNQCVIREQSLGGGELLEVTPATQTSDPLPQHTAMALSLVIDDTHTYTHTPPVDLYQHRSIDTQLLCLSVI